MNYKLLSLVGLMLIIFACEVSTDGDDLNDDIAEAKIDIVSFNSTFGKNDTLLFRGSFSEDIEPTISISGESDFQLVFAGITATELKAFIPTSVEAGDYDLIISVGDQSVTNDAFNDPLTLKVQDRPVITNISENSFVAGSEITIEGGPFVNNSGNTSHEPTIWFMTTGYTNTVSALTINADGTSATVLVDEDIPAGNYRLLITSGEDSEFYTQWSNEVLVTVTE